MMLLKMELLVQQDKRKKMKKSIIVSTLLLSNILFANQNYSNENFAKALDSYNNRAFLDSYLAF